MKWVLYVCSTWICITAAVAEIRTCSGEPVSWYVNYNKTLFHADHYQIQTVQETEIKRCKLHCLTNLECHSFLFHRHGYGCFLLSSNKDFQGGRLVADFAYHYYQWSCPEVTTPTVPKIPVTTPTKVTTPMKTTLGITKSTSVKPITPLLTNPAVTLPPNLLSRIFSSVATQKPSTEKPPTSTTPRQEATSTNPNPERTKASTSPQPSTTTATSTTTKTKHPNYATSSSGFGEREYIIIGCSVTAVIVVAAIVVSIAVCANNRNRKKVPKKAKPSKAKSQAKPKPQVNMVASTSVTDVKPMLPPRNDRTLDRNANQGVKYTTLDGHVKTMDKKHVTISREHEVLGKRDSTNSEEFNVITECYSPVTDAYKTTRKF